MCRDDLYFPEVVDFLDKKYQNTPKVNVVMHACSDGEEVYSFLGVLISRLKGKAAKFLPLTAKDIDSEHLKLAKKGVYNITKTEYVRANNYMNGEFYNYFEPMPSRGSKDPRLKCTSTVKVEHSLKSLVNFRQGNILEDAKNMDYKNTVLFARNFWPYLQNEDINKLINIISQKADNSFTIIIGDYDTGIGDLLRENGFTEVVENVFEKAKNDTDNRKLYDYEYKSIYK
jgi:chemotaxis methyl-accepting protein methylase